MMDSRFHGNGVIWVLSDGLAGFGAQIDAYGSPAPPGNSFSTLGQNKPPSALTPITPVVLPSSALP